MEKCYEIAKSQQQSTRVDFDFLKNSWSFATWQGLDRTENQTENSQVIFSDDFENVMSASYERNKQEHKNFAYVAGEGEGNARTVITVDQTGGTPRCELWVDARDMQKGELSDADYRAQLTQRGTEKLAEYTIVEKAAMTATQDTNLIYKTDYDLGDRCTYLDSQNAIEFEQRITEVVETYENNAVSIQITFGDEHKTMLQKVKRSTS